MNDFLWLAIVLLAFTVLWLLIKLREKVELLEHEVRWLRQELEELKPTEIKSANDPS
jgi:hypothetical protein